MGVQMKSSRRGRRIWIGAAVVALVLLATVAPAFADSESWRLWASTDCNEWSDGCDGNTIYVEGGWTSTTMDNAACVDGVLKIYGDIDGSIQINISGVYVTIASPGGQVYLTTGVMTIPSNATISLFNAGEAFVNGVVVECFDPRSDSVIETVSYGEGGIIVALLFIAGVSLLSVMVHLGERITDR